MFQRGHRPWADRGISFAALVCLLIGTVQPAFAEDDQRLGILSLFGRWDNATVDWYYNPSGAPAAFSSDAFTVGFFQQAMAELEGVSGLQFNYQGTTAASPGNTGDGLVVFGWTNLGGPSGQGGPSASCSGAELLAAGYCHYVDGSVEMAADKDWGDMTTDFAQRTFVQVALHEVGHLVGLGHSNDPLSIMFANPYNNLHHPRSDDIIGLEALYGPPLVPFQEPAYSAPTSGTDSHFTDATFFTDSAPGTPITSFDDSTTGNFIWLKLVVNGIGSALSGNADIVLTDPSGHFHFGTTIDVGCDLNFICTKFQTIGLRTILSTVPGTWTAYVIHNGQTIFTRTLQANTNPVYNTNPAATLTVPVTAGPAPLTINPSVTFNDAEGDDVTVVWHVPGSGETTVATGASSGNETDSFTFTSDGTYTIWVEVNDDATHYGGAGVGFQTLLTETIVVGNVAAPDGDLAPAGVGNGIIDAADFLVMTQLVSGQRTVTAFDLATGDLYPTGSGDGIIDLSDLFVLFKTLYGP